MMRESSSFLFDQYFFGCNALHRQRKKNYSYTNGHFLLQSYANAK